MLRYSPTSCVSVVTVWCYHVLPWVYTWINVLKIACFFKNFSFLASVGVATGSKQGHGQRGVSVNHRAPAEAAGSSSHTTIIAWQSNPSSVSTSLCDVLLLIILKLITITEDATLPLNTGVCVHSATFRHASHTQNKTLRQKCAFIRPLRNRIITIVYKIRSLMFFFLLNGITRKTQCFAHYLPFLMWLLIHLSLAFFSGTDHA